MSVIKMLSAGVGPLSIQIMIVIEYVTFYFYSINLGKLRLLDPQSDVPMPSEWCAPVVF